MGKLQGQATPEQVQDWKGKYGVVYAVTGEGHICYLRKPHRKEVSMALAKTFTDPLGSSESIMQDCWLGGSTALQEDDELFMGVHQQIQQIIGQKDVDIKKL